MRAVIQVLWRGVMQFEHHGWVFVVSNLFAAILALPLVTLPLALAGLSYVSHTAQTTPAAHIDEFWIGVRKYWKEGLIVGILNFAIFGVIIANYIFFLDQAGILFVVLRLMWFVIMLLWIAVQLYLWTILEEMEMPTLREGLRNAGVMIVRNLGFSLLLAFIILIFVLVSVALFAVWALVTPSLIACIGTAATLDRLAVYRAQQH
ncbi:MAG: hypothetical protein KF716_04965 [Anaerolineae bacterium]|nr:hypothetical protein [Anaerolineae bacterium]